MQIAFCLLFLVLFTTSCFAKGPGARDEKEYRDMFKEWKQKHGKAYGQQDETRFQKLKEAIDHIDKHDPATKGFNLSLNEFAADTPEEWAKRFGFLPLPGQGGAKPLNSSKSQKRAIPSSLDWRNAGVVTGVKNQGSCGSCWAFSTAGMIEGAWALQTGELVDLSPQQMLDCNQYSFDCNAGGNPGYASQYVIGNRGIQTWGDYPYSGSKGACKTSQPNLRASTIASWNAVNGVTNILNEVQKGPMVVTGFFSPTNLDMTLYSSGVFYDVFNGCGSPANHAVLLVGYGWDSAPGVLGGDYWIIKNSWGTGWGEAGYIRFKRGTNLCLIEDQAYSLNMCASGYSNSGTCTACPQIGCKFCSAVSPNTCFKCQTGYVLVAGSCKPISCSANCGTCTDAVVTSCLTCPSGSSSYGSYCGQKCLTGGEGATMTLSCPAGTVIQNIRATYGNPPSCPGTPNPAAGGGCAASVEEYFGSCLGLQTCSVVAGNGPFRLDPCYGTSKYTRASYDCLPKGCPAGQTMDTSGTCRKCRTCPSGTYESQSCGPLTDNVCSPCPGGCATCSGGTCYTCYRGYYLATTAMQCWACPWLATCDGGGATGWHYATQGASINETQPNITTTTGGSKQQVTTTTTTTTSGTPGWAVGLLVLGVFVVVILAVLFVVLALVRGKSVEHF